MATVEGQVETRAILIDKTTRDQLELVANRKPNSIEGQILLMIVNTWDTSEPYFGTNTETSTS